MNAGGQRAVERLLAVTVLVIAAILTFPSAELAAVSINQQSLTVSATHSYDPEVNNAHRTLGNHDALNGDEAVEGGDAHRTVALEYVYDSFAAFVAPRSADTTRVGRWMSPDELSEMSSTGRVVEGSGGRTYVVEPPNPAAYPSARPGSVYAEFDVPTDALRTASKPEWSVIPGPNVTTRIYGPPPLEMPPATCIVCVTSN